MGLVTDEIAGLLDSEWAEWLRTSTARAGIELNINGVGKSQAADFERPNDRTVLAITFSLCGVQRMVCSPCSAGQVTPAVLRDAEAVPEPSVTGAGLVATPLVGRVPLTTAWMEREGGGFGIGQNSNGVFIQLTMALLG